MTETDAPAPPQPTDPAVLVVERQLGMLKELGEMGMVVTRAYAHAAVAAAHAVEVILADEYWQPETGRERALAGSKDAADAFQTVSRSVRLTLALEKATAESLRDMQAGVVKQARAARAPEACVSPWTPVPDGPAEVVKQAEIDADGALPRQEGTESERERLIEAERPYGAGFAVMVNGVRAEVGAEAGWADGKRDRRELAYRPFAPKPPGWESKPPPDYRAREVRPPPARPAGLSP